MELAPGGAGKINDSGSDAFSQFDKGIGTALIQAMQDDQQLPAFQNAVIGELFYVHWPVEIGPYQD
jgi:hypothetical protein